VISNDGIEFYLEAGTGIGIIQEIPEENGNYQYEPYRGLGHYAMVTQIKSGMKVKCCVQLEDKIIKFLVTDVPEYGVIHVEMGWEE
jgi:hypothetical protein